MSDSVFRCPHCGAPLSVSPIGARAGFDVRTFKPLSYGDGGASAEAWREATRTIPHAHTPNYDTRFQVGVTLAQSAITAGVITLPAVAVTIAAGWPVHVPLIVGSVSFTASWFWLLRDARGLLRVVEKIVNKDIDGDGAIGDQPAPAPHKPRVEVAITEGDGRKVDRLRYLNLPGDRAHLIALARGVLAGKSTSEATWSGGGRPYSIDGYREVRTALIRAGYARWNHEGEVRQGWSLTAKGTALFKELATLPPALPGE